MDNFSLYFQPQEIYKGIKIHSGEYKSSNEWKGKHGIIVGTANTGTKP